MQNEGQTLGYDSLEKERQPGKGDTQRLRTIAGKSAYDLTAGRLCMIAGWLCEDFRWLSHQSKNSTHHQSIGISRHLGEAPPAVRSPCLEENLSLDSPSRYDRPHCLLSWLQKIQQRASHLGTELDITNRSTFVSKDNQQPTSALSPRITQARSRRYLVRQLCCVTPTFEDMRSSMTV